MYKYLLIILIFISLVFSCKKVFPKLAGDSEVLDGTIEGLSSEENQRFLRGDALFKKVYTRETGLGSIFVETSCFSCHSGDGKGHPSTIVTRFGQTDSLGNLFLNFGGPQLQNRALSGFLPEQIPSGASSARFLAPINVGLGFLDYVSDADILAMSDPNDLDGDGISGVPNWLPLPSYAIPRENSIIQGGKYICRFGKKASSYDLMEQIVFALNQDIGITSNYDLKDVFTNQEIDPEITNTEVLDMLFYLRTLKAPTPRNQDDAEVQKGKNIFSQLNCIACHKPTLTTGNAPISGLSNKEFHPYTDLLLHDMGATLDDGYTEGTAKTSEWRTAPLWGLGLAKNSQGGSYYLLHDGRAHSLGSAISYHGGEAENSKKLFQLLSAEDKQALYKFLESL